MHERGCDALLCTTTRLYFCIQMLFSFAFCFVFRYNTIKIGGIFYAFAVFISCLMFKWGLCSTHVCILLIHDVCDRLYFKGVPHKNIILLLLSMHKIHCRVVRIKNTEKRNGNRLFCRKIINTKKFINTENMFCV